MEKVLLSSTNVSSFIKQYKHDEFSSRKKNTMLNIATKNSVNIDILEFLLKKGCTIDNEGFDNIIRNYYHQKDTIIRLLIKYKIKLNSTNLNSVINHNTSVIHDLIEYNVNPDKNTFTIALNRLDDMKLVKEIYDYCKSYDMTDINQYPSHDIEKINFIINVLKIPITSNLISSIKIPFNNTNNNIKLYKSVIIEIIKQTGTINAELTKACVILPCKEGEDFVKYMKQARISCFVNTNYIIDDIDDIDFLSLRISNKNILDFMLCYYFLTSDEYINRLKCFANIFSKTFINSLISNNTTSLLYSLHNIHLVQSAIDILGIADNLMITYMRTIKLINLTKDIYRDIHELEISEHEYDKEFKKVISRCMFNAIDVDENKLPETCNDIIDATTYTIESIIDEKIVFVGPNDTGNWRTDDIMCYDKDVLNDIINDVGNKFYNCIGDFIANTNDKKLGFYSPENEPYIKFPVNIEGFNGFFAHNDMTHMYRCTQFCKLFYIVPKLDENGVQMSFTHSIDWNNAFAPPDEQSRISANHCQSGSNILLYTFAICKDIKKCVKSLIYRDVMSSRKQEIN